jgi:hypothetical protein
LEWPKVLAEGVTQTRFGDNLLLVTPESLGEWANSAKLLTGQRSNDPISFMQPI